jgi:hypothetical protein
MPSYFFPNPELLLQPLTDPGIDAANRDAAPPEIIKVFGDLVGNFTKGLEQNTERQIELLDASKRPLFRVRADAASFE